jgi:hypothetical protein
MSPLDPKSKAEAHPSIEAMDGLHRAREESWRLPQSNRALQAEVSESHSEFDEALWQLRETMAMIREGRAGVSLDIQRTLD